MKLNYTQLFVISVLFQLFNVLEISLCMGTEEIQKKEIKNIYQESRPISNGFVFVEGQYIEAPYVVSQRDQAIYINGHLIANYASLVRDFLPLDKTRPILPSTITSNANPEDPLIGDYLYRIGNYLATNHSRTEAREEMVTVLKELPCINNVSCDTDQEYATVEFVNGRVVSMGLLPFHRKTVITSLSVGEYVIRDYTNYIDRLYAGTVYSFSGNGSRKHSFSHAIAQDILPRFVKILRSSHDDVVKAKELADMLGMETVPNEQVSVFVRNVSPAKQLDERVKKIVAVF